MMLMACMTIFLFTNLKVSSKQKVQISQGYIKLLSFLQVFPPLVEVINLYGCMFIYAGFCILGTFVTIFCMPETKGKNLFQNYES